MNERDALVAEILRDPFNDAVRLAYADWLRESDDEGRADFIQAQISVERHRNEKHGPQHVPARLDSLRATKLWGVHGRSWVADLPGKLFDIQSDFNPIFSRGHVSYEFQRGFPCCVRLALTRFTDNFCRRLFQVAPITSVVITDRYPNVAGGPGFAWRGSPLWREMRDSLPLDLFRRFWEFGILQPDYPAQWATGREAEAALNRLCVDHGRSMAGLAPLNRGKQSSGPAS